MALPAVAAAVAPSLIQWIFKTLGNVEDESNRAERIAHRERFAEALRDIQISSLKLQHARRNYSLSRNENIVYGRQASSMAKSRLGVAGTASESFQSVMQKYDFHRKGFETEMLNQLGKFAVERKASQIAVEKKFDMSRLILKGVADGLDAYSDIMQANRKISRQSSGKTITKDPQYRDPGLVPATDSFMGDL